MVPAPLKYCRASYNTSIFYGFQLMSDRFDRNLDILRGRFPRAAEAAASADDGVALERASSGAMTGRAGAIWLASKYDPAREAETFVKGQAIAPGQSVALYGFGLGHHIRPLLDAVGPEGRVVAAEANASILRAAMEVMEDHEALSDGRLVIVAAKGEEAFLDEWAGAFGALDPASTKVAIHEPSRQSIPADHKKVVNAVEMIRMERRFPLIMGGAEKENFRRNLPRLMRSPGIGAMQGALKGAVAAIVGAGPSLDRDMIHMAAGDRMAILSSDTALPALTAEGVTPDLVFTVDPQKNTLAHFEMAGRFDLPLALTPFACADLVEKWEGPLFFGFQRPERFPSPACGWAEDMGVFRTGGTVSLIALETALLMGASAVILFGQDFGWPGGRKYARGVAPAFLGNVLPEEKDRVYETDFFGGRIMTSTNLYAYRRDFESLARAAGVPVVTMSAEGVRLEGVAPVASPLPWLAKGARGPAMRLEKQAQEPASPEVERAFMSWLEEA